MVVEMDCIFGMQYKNYNHDMCPIIDKLFNEVWLANFKFY